MKKYEKKNCFSCNSENYVNLKQGKISKSKGLANGTKPFNNKMKRGKKGQSKEA